MQTKCAEIECYEQMTHNSGIKEIIRMSRESLNSAQWTEHNMEAHTQQNGKLNWKIVIARKIRLEKLIKQEKIEYFTIYKRGMIQYEYGRYTYIFTVYSVHMY